MNKWCEKEIDLMISVVSSCKNDEQVIDIFDKILTPREINDMARRLKILIMLDEGKSYAEIKDELGVGGDVIARVANKIGYGFRRAHATIDKRDKNEKKWEDPLSRKKGIYYKGAPSVGTLIRHIK